MEERAEEQQGDVGEKSALIQWVPSCSQVDSGPGGRASRTVSCYLKSPRDAWIFSSPCS